MSKILGIDLGTTNSCMSVMEGGQPVVIPNSEGANTTPSIVAFNKAGERLVGQAAKRQAVMNPLNTVFSAKRLIGRKYPEVKEEAKNLPFKVVEGRNGDAEIELLVGGKTERFTPQQISAFVLMKLKADAEAYLGETISQAVITVPAYFNDAQRQATKDAGTIAGLEVLRIINEPTAASLAYGLDKKSDETIAVFDLGGGTFDISALEIGGGVFEVKATNGDTHLGGDNWDSAIIDFLVDTFQKQEGINLRKDPTALQRLKEEAEKAKIALSSANSYDINLAYITATAEGPKHLQVTLTRSKMEQICDSLFQRLFGPVNACLKDADLTAKDIDNLVLVGGMTRMPKVVDVARQLGGGKEPHKGVNPDEVVAVGAAIQGAILKKDPSVSDILLLDVTPLTLAIETAGGVATAMIERNTTIPTKKSQLFSTYSDFQTQVTVKVLQGERPMARDNKMLGEFNLTGIPPAPRGTPQIEVTFDINSNGILTVTAKDMGTGKDQKITITNSSGLSKDEVERLRQEAEKYAAEDARRREAAETKNKLDTLVYEFDKLLKENGDKLDAAKKPALEAALNKAREALKSDELEPLKAALEGLQNDKAVQEAVASLYQAAAAKAQAEAAGPTAGDAAANNKKPGATPDNGGFEVVDDEPKK